MKQKCNEWIQWLAAIMLAGILVNFLCFFYSRSVGWFDTPDGESSAIQHPEKMIVTGTEGYGISKVDKNGFMNPDRPLADSYLLITGSSHSQGKSISSNRKYPVLISDALSRGDGKLHTYNIACDGHFLPDILTHFQNSVRRHPNAAGILIELGQTDFDPESLLLGPAAPEASPVTAEALYESRTPGKKIRQFIMEEFPLINTVKNRLQEHRNVPAEADLSAQEIDLSQYEKAIQAALKAMRESYEKPIVVLYHPRTVLTSDGTLVLDYDRTWELFQEACLQNHIGLIDLGPDFQAEYEAHHRLPYGFSNTTPGSGHLNSTGHRIAAQAVLNYLNSTEVAKP